MERKFYESKIDKINYLERKGWRENKGFGGGWVKINWTQPKDNPPLPLELAFIIEREYNNQETLKSFKE